MALACGWVAGALDGLPGSEGAGACPRRRMGDSAASDPQAAVGVSGIHGFGAGLRSVDRTGEVGAIREPDPGLDHDAGLGGCPVRIMARGIALASAPRIWLARASAGCVGGRGRSTRVLPVHDLVPRPEAGQRDRDIWRRRCLRHAAVLALPRRAARDRRSDAERRSLRSPVRCSDLARGLRRVFTRGG